MSRREESPWILNTRDPVAMEIADRWDEANDKAPRVRIVAGDRFEAGQPGLDCQLCPERDPARAIWKIVLRFETGDKLEYRRRFKAEFAVCAFHVRYPWTVERPKGDEA